MADNIIADFSEDVLNKLKIFVQRGIYANVKDALRDIINYYLKKTRPELLASNEFYKSSRDTFVLPEEELDELVEIIFGDSSKTKTEFEIGSSEDL